VELVLSGEEVQPLLRAADLPRRQDVQRLAELDFIDQNKDRPFFIYYPMALVHSPFIHPPELEPLARTRFTDDLDKNTVAFGHMVTYMDHLVGKVLARLKEHGLERNTLVLFTGDNGTGTQITSRLAGMKLKGGKGSMTEAGSRVPLLAWWPGTIEPAVRDGLFCLVDVLPTITSLAGIQPGRRLDGMNLSHHLVGGTGKDREHVLINLNRGWFVRDQRFRLNQDGKLYDIPVTSDQQRYREKQSTDPQYDGQRQRLQSVLDEFMAIQREYETPSRSGSKKQKTPKKSGKKKAGKDA
jgi:arylsulfatase A